FLSGPESWHAWFFIGFAVLVIGLLFTWLWQLPDKHKLLVGSYGLILGGALSNLWDRLTLGQVVDFIDVYYQTYHWPIFNVADSAICIG
ncbi:signal peptidase II, partial [Escherichia coli]|uniref:signal peptidase II n=1 Tax=Escherichia coli TaxID=562 RepID=UPI0021E02EA6